MRVLAMLDGTLIDADSPVLRVDDLGLTRGDGVFETVLVVDGAPRELDAHLARMVQSARMLELPDVDVPAWERVCRVVIDAWSEPGEMALKLVCTRGPEYGDGGPTAFAAGLPVGAETLRRREHGVSAITLDRGFHPDVVERAPWLLIGAKSLSYAVNMAALRYAATAGAEEAIFVASDGTVLEGPTCTIVTAHGTTLRTTPATTGVLPGTTQAALFRAAERAGWSTKVEPFHRDELFTADGVFVVSSMRKVTRVRVVDGIELPDSVALHADLMAVYESEY